MLFPKKTKYKKYQKLKDRFKGMDNRYVLPKIGNFGLKIIKTFRLTAKHIETLRKVVKQKMSKSVKAYIKLTTFPDLPVSCKSAGLRMGKGKGHLNFWSFPIQQGRILLEITNILPVTKHKMIICLNKGSQKLPSGCRIIIT